MGKDIGTLTFETFNDLRQLTGNSLSTVKVLGKDTANDSFGGVFYYNTASTAPDDNDSVLQPSGVTTGRWLRLQLTTGVPPPVNIGNTNLTLTSNRTLAGAGFNFTLQGTGTTLLSGGTTILQSTGDIVIKTLTEQTINLTTSNASVSLGTDDLTSNRSYKFPDSSGTFLTEENGDEEYAKKPLMLTSNGSGVITNSYLVDKDLLLLVTSGVTLEKGRHFTKALNSNTVTMISPNTLLINHNYTPTYG